MDGFRTLDTLIRDKLDGITAAHREINPLFVTSEEVAALLEEPWPDVDMKRILPGLEILANLFRLDDFETKALLVVMAPEISSRYERIYAYLQDDLNRKYPTASLIAALLSNTPEEALHAFPYFSPRSPLRLFRLITVIDPGDGTPLIHRPVRLEDSVRDFILGYYQLDSRLHPFCQPILPADGNAFSPKSDPLPERIGREAEQGGRFLIHLHGGSDSERQNSALQIASELGYGLLRVHTPQALQSGHSLSDLMELLYREAVLSGTLPYFDGFDAFYEDAHYPLSEPLFFEGLERYSWLTFVASRAPWKPGKLPKSQMFLEFAFAPPEYQEALMLWEKHLGAVDTALAAEMAPSLAELFRFSEEEMAEVVNRLRTRRFAGKEVDAKTVYKSCRARVSGEIGRLAQRVTSDATLQEIALPKAQLMLLETIISHYTHQRRVFEEWGFRKYFQSPGIGTLFVGPPGTGKTMGASILANAMGLDLYRIELSQVVSKYIGETEKNLSRIFEAAEGSGVMLFFDEADAIFGKRTEIRDAHDRYANIEISYLLQKMEAYNGPVVLATNFRKNVDDAFVRRLRFIVEFPFPDATMRESIWKKVFPVNAPLGPEIDFALLAKSFKLSGASIRNIALLAAFSAAEAGGTITMRHIMQGIKTELQKAGESVKPSDFGEYWEGD